MTMNNIFLNSIYLFLPISVYLNYSTYMKNLEMKEKDIVIELALLVSLILMMRYDTSQTIYSFTMYSIPPLIALYKKRTTLYFVLVGIITSYASVIHPTLVVILILKYIFYLVVSSEQNTKTTKTNIFLQIFLESIVLIIIRYKTSTSNISSIAVLLIVFIINSYIIINILQKEDKIIDLSKVLKELEHEKLLRASISKLTHELKNPIAVCQGYLEMLNLNNREKSEKYISIITSEINRSKTIIDEFSNYGKLKKIDVEEMDISYLLDDIIALLTPLFKQNKATLTINNLDEIYIKGDYNKLKQVFINLLKNTLEAKKEESSLKVNIIIKESKNNLTIKIIDNGIGMNEETLSRVSEVFYTTKRNGTGLGLAYSKEVIKLHKGNLKIKSELNKGTEMIITLPQ